MQEPIQVDTWAVTAVYTVAGGELDTATRNRIWPAIVLAVARDDRCALVSPRDLKKLVRASCDGHPSSYRILALRLAQETIKVVLELAASSR